MQVQVSCPRRVYSRLMKYAVFATRPDLILFRTYLQMLRFKSYYSGGEKMKRGELGASLNLEIELIPEGRPNRPGVPITIKKITVHNTSNTSRGADAASHSNWVRNTGYYEIEVNGRVKRNYVSWHYTVDDKRVIKQLPISENGWHSGRRGNSSSIGIEICMHQGIEQEAAFDRASRLIAVLLYDLKLAIEDVVTHKYWTGKDCPILLLQGRKWEEFKDKIRGYLERMIRESEDPGDEDV